MSASDNPAQRPLDASGPPRGHDAQSREQEAEEVEATLLWTPNILGHSEYQEGHGRRRFLTISAMATSLAGVGLFVWPFLQSMNPASDVEATATTEVDLSTIPPGESLTTIWRGKPVFVRHRTPAEIEAARRDDNVAMPEPQTDAERIQRPEWLVAIGICQHLGCVPRGQRQTDPKGEYGGWFCPCHGSHFDTSGRVRKGPAPNNLAIPQYTFIGENRLRIG